MVLDNDEVKMLVTDMLKYQSERDRQVKIGPSEIGNPCDYCVARRLAGQKDKGNNKYWLGAVLGTAMHSFLESVVQITQPSKDYKFKYLKNASSEVKIKVGTMSGYGDIYGHVDLYLVSGNLIDFKSSNKKKVAGYKLDGVPEQYIVQQTLYAHGLIEQGKPVENISLVFVNRDGSGDGDVWVYTFKYDEKIYEKAWKRLDKIWSMVQDGSDPEEHWSDPGCFYCNVVIHRF